MNEDTALFNAMYMIEIENLYASRSDMIISISKKIFYCKLSPVTSYKSIQICKNGKSSLENGSLLHI